MQNRYDKGLRDANKEILALTPANETLRLVVAFEFKKFYKKGEKVLEIGCGEGDSARYVLERTNAKLDMLDISKEMIFSCKKNLSMYGDRIKYICEDALSFLKRNDPYKIILSSWTIHNFKQKDKKQLFETIFHKLEKNGAFICMDKVYPRKGGKELLELQVQRYHHLEPSAYREIAAHEKADYTDTFRMDEKPLLKTLKGIGFRKILIVDRVERDIVFIAYK